jgi:hypothetical protein
VNETISTTGQAINQAGGGLTGAIAIIIVIVFACMVILLLFLWKAYQKLLKESRERETKLIEMNLISQATQKETNEILKEIRTYMGTMDVRMQCLEKQIGDD